MRYAIVEDGVVINVVNWDGSRGWTPPVGSQALRHDTASVGWTYHDNEFFAPDDDVPVPTVLRREVYKSIVLSRLTDEQLDAALVAMNNRQRERWRSPDSPTVFVDDAEVIGLLRFIGADPAVVLAPNPEVSRISSPNLLPISR